MPERGRNQPFSGRLVFHGYSAMTAPSDSPSEPSPETPSPEAWKASPLVLAATAAVSAGVGLVLGLSLGNRAPGAGSGDPGGTFDDKVTGTKLPVDWPMHFCSTYVEKTYPTSRAIPNPPVITTAGGTVSIMAHPDSAVAQLRVIRLPGKLHAKPDAARVLAESGAIQDGDVLVVFRKEWAKANPYGNLQLGQGHAALATVDQDAKGKIVKTVESPLSYSSNLDHPGHYGGHKTFQVIRPNLTDVQKVNVAKWARLVLAKEELQFQGDYGAPYFARFKGKDPESLCVDLALATLYGAEGEPVAAFCSELIWALLGLRDVNPDDVLKRFPQGGDAKGGARQFVASNVKAIFPPMVGATRKPLEFPGLMQGPDVVLRRVFAGDDAKRHEFLINTVLAPKTPTQTELDGIMSAGHQKTAVAFQPKIDQFKLWYGEKKESPGYLKDVNMGINPNYSPTAFSILANSDAKGPNGKLLYYVGTVTFE